MKIGQKIFQTALASIIAVGFTVPAQSLAAVLPNKVQANDYFQMERMGPYFMGQYFQGSMHEIIAEKLGMTTKELFEARIEGKTIAELLKEKKLDPADVVKDILEERESVLNEMIKAKMIKKEDKELLLERMKTRLDAMINSETVVPRKSNDYYQGSGCFMMNGFPKGMSDPKSMGRGKMKNSFMWQR
ncbi:hypothetical protein [Calidifontibacillus erzurumensis]|uniref:DUF2680 domain-containing protein n=1 Tax=Calidifontibacillus erzurumensis TaxID=2741433 RepID=A0A8J8GBR2_9BACI|nr:hypothetical protein [Calidifontibacillus erzurumensis]NSL50609.1 hypothetical protein [Calidifontibacillus erzurumensis]